LGDFFFLFVNYTKEIEMDERIIRYFGGELTETERMALLRERETDEKIKEDFAAI
jgi:hypothetical protein